MVANTGRRNSFSIDDDRCMVVDDGRTQTGNGGRSSVVVVGLRSKVVDCGQW